MKKVSFIRKWLYASLKMFRPQMFGLSVSAFILLVTKASRLTFVVWGALLVLMIIISLLLGWSEARKQ